MRLVAVEGAVGPGLLPARRLDLDDVGPEAGQQLPAVLAELVGELEDPDPREKAAIRLRHHPPSYSFPTPQSPEGMCLRHLSIPAWEVPTGAAHQIEEVVAVEALSDLAGRVAERRLEPLDRPTPPLHVGIVGENMHTSGPLCSMIQPTSSVG